MAAKGTRNTVISFGGYSVPVSLRKATVSRDLKTIYVNEQGEKVTMTGGAAGGSRTPAPGVVKAADLGGGQYVPLPAAELEQIAEQSAERWRDMEVLEAISLEDVPSERLQGSYWIQPQGGTAKGLRLLALALDRLGRAVVVKWCASSREKLGVIRVWGSQDGLALLLSELAFANDFAGPDEDALSINRPAVEDREVEAAERLVQAFVAPAGSRPVDEVSDEAVDARLALLERVVGERAAVALERSTAMVH